MRGAPFGLRPCKVQKLLTIRVTFNRHGTTHGSFPTSLIFRKFLFPRGFHLFRGAIRRERPAFHPALRPQTNLNHFYPVAGARRKPTKSRSTGFCAGAAGNSSTEYGYIQNLYNKKRGFKIPLVKVLEVKGLLSRSPLWVWAKPKVLLRTSCRSASRDCIPRARHPATSPCSRCA